MSRRVADLCQAQIDHAGARYRRGGQLRTDHRRSPAPRRADVQAVNIAESGHWAAEEQADAAANALFFFLPPIGK
jgi:ribosomal protein L15E